MTGATARMGPRGRFWIACALLGLVAILSGIGESGNAQGRSSQADAPIPTRIGDWVGRDVPLSPRTLELLGTDRVINRAYLHPSGDRVHLCLVRSSGDRRALHPPEVCYRGWGYEICGRQRLWIGVSGPPELTFRANAVSLRKEAQTSVALFWYQVGEHFLSSYVHQQLLLALSRITGGSDRVGGLVRLSTSLAPGELERNGLQRMARFIEELAPVLLDASQDRK